MAFRPRLAQARILAHAARRRGPARSLATTTDSQSSAHPQLAPPPVLRSVDLHGQDAPNRGPHEQGELSDQEWEIRTGRAIYILQQTLPTFFSTGLIASLDTSGPGPEPNAKDDEVSIYSPNIRLQYRPPTALPPPFPRTLHVEGLPLYLASSAFIRHTLNALYTDLHVELNRVRVHGSRSASGRSLDSPSTDNQEDIHPPQQQAKTRAIREKSLFVGLTVHGTNRVSKAQGGWEVNSTYTFSPLTGLIHVHNIDSILPEPHVAFFSALQAALSKIGIGGSQGATGAGPVARTSSPAPQHPLSVPNRS